MWISNVLIWALLMIAIDARYSRSKNDASKWVRTVKSSSNITPIVERDVANASPSDTREVIGGNVPLRVLLIGDSILVGYASMDFNGFRQKLYDAFVNSGSTSVDFIGTQQLGNDTKVANHFEGYPGHRVKMLHDKLIMSNILAQQPNIVLVIAGTNDLNQDDILFSADEPRALALYRFQRMLEYITCVVPDAVTLVATLPPIKNETAQALAVEFNAGIPAIVEPGQVEGFKLGVVEMADIDRKFMAWDGIHPNDEGYSIVAQRWFDALLKVPTGWIQAPRNPDMVAMNATAKTCADRTKSPSLCHSCQGIWNCLWEQPGMRCGGYR